MSYVTRKWLGSCQLIARSFVSGRTIRATTDVARATPTGYQRPAKMLPSYITNAEATKGRKPPTRPTPRRYGSDSEVVLILAGNNSTKNAAIGPYTIPPNAISHPTTAIAPT